MERNQLALTVYKKVCVLVVFFLLSLSLTAQNYEGVDSLVAHYPKTFKDPSLLAERITTDFDSPYERVRALYDWMVFNVRYERAEGGIIPRPFHVSIEDHEETLAYQKKLAKHVITKNKAVCEGYSRLFKEVCSAMDIRCNYVTGFVKSGIDCIYGEDADCYHAWNIVVIDDTSYLIDTTWGAGVMANDTWKQKANHDYFFAKPEHMILTHHPDKEKHSLLENIISRKDFKKLPRTYSDSFGKYQLVSPGKSGVLRMGASVDFVIETEETITRISYLLGETYYTVDTYEQQDNQLQFSIDLSNKKGRELILFINRDAVAGYKVRR